MNKHVKQLKKSSNHHGGDVFLQNVGNNLKTTPHHEPRGLQSIIFIEVLYGSVSLWMRYGKMIMNNRLRGIWGKAVVVYFKIYSGISLNRPWETIKKNLSFLSRCEPNTSYTHCATNSLDFSQSWILKHLLLAKPLFQQTEMFNLLYLSSPWDTSLCSQH